MPRPEAQLTEEELLLRYRQSGDRHWLGLLLQRHTVLLLGVAMKYLKDGEAAADAVQSVFLKALTHFPAAEMKNVKGWLYILVRNHCLQILREKVHLLPEEVLQTVAGNAETAEAELLEKEYTLQKLEAGLQRLNAGQQTVLRLFYLEHKSYAEVQEITGYNYGQVKSYIQNGKRALRLLLEQKSVS